MSPVAPSSGHASKALLLAGATILVGMLALWGASVLLTNRHNGRAGARTLGGVVSLGKADTLAKSIDKARRPVFYPDVSGNHERDLYLQHRGTDPKTGWTAFLVAVPDAPAGCVWQWNDGLDRFDASCDAARHAPPDGAGLVRYPVRVEEDTVRVDLRSSTPGPGTTAPPEPGTTTVTT